MKEALSAVGNDALDLMQKRIIEMAARDEEIHSLRQIYDIWVDCNEEAYAKLAYSDEFSELYGKVTNALMGLKRYGRNVIDEMLGALNMPTRKGINTMQKRQQELRRDFKAANRKIESLEEDLQALKRELGGGTASSGSRQGGKKKTAAKKTGKKKTGKKKTARKKAAKKKTSRKRGGDDMITIKI